MDLLDLKSGQCRYPRGDELPYDFCGAPVAQGSYCEGHARLCIDTKKPRDWQNLWGMINASEQSVVPVRTLRELADPIDEVFRASRIGEKPLLERVL